MAAATASPARPPTFQVIPARLNFYADDMVQI